jgi:hypothetical protein
VTRWGLLLLVAFLVIGLRPSMDARRAVRWVVGLASVILVYTFVRGHAL